MDDGVLLSKRDAGRVQGMLRWFERGGRQAPRFRRRKNPDDGIIIRIVLSIFQVQSVTAVDGVYLCFRQTLAGGWGTDEIEVLNLIENDTLASYTPMLAYQDRIAGWQTVDENGTSRWVGMPVTPSVRMARTTEAAGASTSITCNLIANDGETEILSGLGSAIEVYFRVCTSDNMNGASPRFNDNDYLFVQNISGKWWCVGVAQGSENRVCE